ncbi:MAG: helix-turn-helix transcriptional regulator [Rhodospirillaceae bacterium]|nr:helix-turn-helix transcriptional regulator [Rhodospirillaceae bacterium]
MKSSRLQGLPEHITKALVQGRKARGWSQAEVSRRVGLPQTHISGIETGRIVPRYDTLLELLRLLDHDLVVVPRPLVPSVKALVRGHGQPDEQPLYANGDDDGDDANDR